MKKVIQMFLVALMVSFILVVPSNAADAEHTYASLVEIIDARGDVVLQVVFEVPIENSLAIQIAHNSLGRNGQFTNDGLDIVEEKAITCCDRMNKMNHTYSVHSPENPTTKRCTITTYKMVYCINCNVMWEPAYVSSVSSHVHPEIFS